ncbi:hypothetical protein HMPREF9069_00578 [Atopobium sp. oral taxon 810 str. F0209]|nr:hypothetical protein HMPREF9069_00578 [Atopobium sp. oral taxon 810 str. F0209]
MGRSFFLEVRNMNHLSKSIQILTFDKQERVESSPSAKQT